MSVRALCTCMYAKGLAQESSGHPRVQTHRGREGRWERGGREGGVEKGEREGRGAHGNEEGMRSQQEKKNEMNQTTKSKIFILSINNSYQT